eukprot:SAG31_NODE_25100_length_468_cov_0.688347_1_plen_80_part_10
MACDRSAGKWNRTALGTRKNRTPLLSGTDDILEGTKAGLTRAVAVGADMVLAAKHVFHAGGGAACHWGAAHKGFSTGFAS